MNPPVRPQAIRGVLIATRVNQHNRPDVLVMFVICRRSSTRVSSTIITHATRAHACTALLQGKTILKCIYCPSNEPHKHCRRRPTSHSEASTENDVINRPTANNCNSACLTRRRWRAAASLPCPRKVAEFAGSISRPIGETKRPMRNRPGANPPPPRPCQRYAAQGRENNSCAGSLCFDKALLTHGKQALGHEFEA